MDGTLGGLKREVISAPLWLVEETAWLTGLSGGRGKVAFSCFFLDENSIGTVIERESERTGAEL